MNNAYLAFENVTIQYPLYNSRNMSLRNQLVRLGTGGRIENEAGRVQVVTALKNASFVIEHGQTVGLVGHNGAGKSTLLRTMAGIYTPASGTVIRQGRVATMLELGSGVDPELSGYENITRMGMLLGMAPDRLRATLADIEDFSELGDFLHLPLRTYSSGMATRLMFAVATSSQPDILLVDEMFGTGDAAFQISAKKRMESLIASVGIFVFASHDDDLIRTYCQRLFFLNHGVVEEISHADLSRLRQNP